jgi:hypothetical protein
MTTELFRTYVYGDVANEEACFVAIVQPIVQPLCCNCGSDGSTSKQYRRKHVNPSEMRERAFIFSNSRARQLNKRTCCKSDFHLTWFEHDEEVSHGSTERSRKRARLPI